MKVEMGNGNSSEVQTRSGVMGMWRNEGLI